MNLNHALTVEKMILSHIEGNCIDDFYTINVDSKEFVFNVTVDSNQFNYVFDGLEELLIAPSGPGFYLITDKNTNEHVIIELKQSLSATIR